MFKGHISTSATKANYDTLGVPVTSKIAGFAVSSA